MKLKTSIHKFKLLTSSFCRGALNGPGDQAEMRAPSIRGQIRQWHREMPFDGGGKRADEIVDLVWGSAGNGDGCSSKISLSVSPLETSTNQESTLPHSNERAKVNNRLSALPASDLEYTLEMRWMPMCDKRIWEEAERAVKLWLLLGGVGLRVNRAAGSVWPLGEWAPKTTAELKSSLTALRCRWPVMLADHSLGETAAELRKEASNTLDGNPDVFGSIRPRVSSPLKMKVAQIDGRPRLLITAQSHAVLCRAKALLAEAARNAEHRLGETQWERVHL